MRNPNLSKPSSNTYAMFKLPSIPSIPSVSKLVQTAADAASNLPIIPVPKLPEGVKVPAGTVTTPPSKDVLDKASALVSGRPKTQEGMRSLFL